MKPKNSPRDLKYLSLYLDKQLSPIEQQRLEKRLQENQPLRKLLDELRETRRVLRAMPKARAPRNFTVSPQMIGSQPARPAYPILGFVSALASILFVLVLAGDLLGFFTRRSSSIAFQLSSQYEAAAPAMDNAQEKSVQAATSTYTPGLEETQLVGVEELKAAEPAAVFPTTPEASQAEGGGDETAVFPLAESYAKEAPAPSTGIAGDLALDGVVTSTEILEMELLPMETSTGQVVTATPVSTPTSNAQATVPTSSAIHQETARAAVPAAEDNPAAQAIGESETADTQDQEWLVAGEEDTSSQARESSEIMPGQWILWVLEGVFAVTALISGALVISRRRRLS